MVFCRRALNPCYGVIARCTGELFARVRALVQSVVDGYNGCVFAYGQVRLCCGCCWWLAEQLTHVLLVLYGPRW